MPLTMNTLEGFMRVGPQVYPERPGAVQVIERGWHGRRFAPDPVLAREASRRGSGFRFWREQLNVPASEAWNPPQRVVGLLGLPGANGAMSRLVRALGREELSSSDVCNLVNSNPTFHSELAVYVFPGRASVKLGVGEVESAVSSSKSMTDVSRASALLCLLREAAGQHGYDSGGESKAATAAMNRLHLILIQKKGIKTEDGLPRIAPGIVDKSGRIQKITEADYCRSNPHADGCRDIGQSRPGGSCAPWDTVCKINKNLSANWWKYAIGGAAIAGGVVFLSSFAGGLGRGLAQR